MTTKNLDPTKPVVFENLLGEEFPARILCTDRKGYYPVVSLVELEKDREIFHAMPADGLFDGIGRLKNISVKSSVWRIVWSDKVGLSIYSRKAVAEGVGIAGVFDKRREFVGLFEHQYEDDEFVGCVFHPKESL